VKGIKKWMNGSVGTYNVKEVEEGRGIRIMIRWAMKRDGKGM
jgi:hypothetical protein